MHVNFYPATAALTALPLLIVSGPKRQSQGDGISDDNIQVFMPVRRYSSSFLCACIIFMLDLAPLIHQRT